MTLTEAWDEAERKSQPSLLVRLWRYLFGAPVMVFHIPVIHREPDPNSFWIARVITPADRRTVVTIHSNWTANEKHDALSAAGVGAPRRYRK